MFEYEVLTQRDSKFSGTFDADALAATLNARAVEGWRLAEGFMTANVMKTGKAEIVLILERSTDDS